MEFTRTESEIDGEREREREMWEGERGDTLPDVSQSDVWTTHVENACKMVPRSKIEPPPSLFRLKVSPLPPLIRFRCFFVLV